MSLTNDQITAQNFSDFYNKISPYLGIAHAGFTPVGALVIMTGNEVPANHLACDGTVYNISAYPELAAYYARSQGACNFYGGDGTTTFAVPDLRGEFIRGAGTNSHENQGSGGTAGQHQDGSTLSQYYVINNNLYVRDNSNPDESGGSIGNADSNISGSVTQLGGIASSSTPATGDVSYTLRPTNTSFLICVAAKNIFNDVGNNYSLEEQEVGTWVDGSKIYQKTIPVQLSTIAAKTVNYYNLTSDTSFRLIYGYGLLIRSDGIRFVIPAINIGVSTGLVDYHLRIVQTTDNIIKLQHQAYAASNMTMDGYCTIQYTKVSS